MGRLAAKLTEKVAMGSIKRIIATMTNDQLINHIRDARYTVARRETDSMDTEIERKSLAIAEAEATKRNLTV